MRIIFVSFVLLFLLVSSCARLSPHSHDDLEIVFDRMWTEEMLDDRIDPPSTWRLPEMEEWKRQLTPDYTWPDLDYAHAKSDYRFSVSQHLGRMNVFAKAYAHPKHPYYHRTDIRDLVLKLIDHWLANDYQSFSWWHQEIGTPLSLKHLLFLMKDELGSQRTDAILRLMDRSAIDYNGQNLVWVAEIHITKGLFKHDREMVAAGFKAIQDEVRKGAFQGIQEDNSFFQHGRLFYSGGYGRNFSLSVARFVALADGTRFAFSPEKIQVLSESILDGQRWMVRGRTFDYGGIGREIARPGHSGGITIQQVCRTLAALPLPRQRDFETCRDELGENKSDILSGNRWFWNSLFMVNRGPDFYSSVRMFSDQIYNTDNPSGGEGIRSHHIADGTTFFMISGDEYRDIFPVWDWKKIPGTTVEQSPLIPAYYIPGDPKGDNVKILGEHHFVGGTSDGSIGLAAEDFKRGGLRAKKAWFHFKSGMVALGADISCPTCTYDVLTTIDQRRSQGEVRTRVYAGGDERVIPRGKTLIPDAHWITHAGIATIFPQSTPVIVKNEAQTGSWSLIASAMPNKPENMDVFSLWISHGKKPKNASYAYAVSAIRANRMVAKINQGMDIVGEFRILENSAAIQAIEIDKGHAIEAVFYRPGTLRGLSGFGHAISVDRPCFLLMQEDDGRISITASLVNENEESLGVSIRGLYHGENISSDSKTGTSTITLRYMGDAFRGRPQTHVIFH